MKENINALDEVNKGTTMGMDAINFIIDKVQDKELKKGLKNQYKKYNEIYEKINTLYKKYNKEDKPHETNIMNKVMTWYGVEIRTITDQSNSNIAELLIKGTNMGIIEGRKILNNKVLDKDVISVIKDFVKLQEDSLEELKSYL